MLNSLSKMKLSCALFLLPLFLLSACASQSKYTVRRPFLYQVTKGGQKGYLFGTMHSGVVDDDLPESFWSYFNNSDAYAFEEDINNLSSFRKRIIEDLVLVSEFDFANRLESLMAPKDFEKFKSLLVKHYPEQADFLINRLTPFGAMAFLEEINQRHYLISHGEAVRLNSKFNLDMQLLKRVESAGKVVSFLDRDISEYVRTCAYGNRDYYLKQISKSLNAQEQEENTMDLFRDMVEHYRKGDEKALSSMKVSIDERDTCLLAGRNKLWMNKITSLFETYESPFVAVGAAHLTHSPDSLIDLLKERGYQIRRVEFPQPAP